MISSVDEAQGWTTLGVAIVTMIGGIVIAKFQFGARKTTREIRHDQVANGGDSGRDVLDRLEQRSILTDGRLERLDRKLDTRVDAMTKKMDRIMDNQDGMHERLERVEQAAIVTHAVVVQDVVPALGNGDHQLTEGRDNV